MDKGKGKMPLWPLQPKYPKDVPPFYKNYPHFPNEDNTSDKPSFKNLSPYIQKPICHRLCYLEQTPDILENCDPNEIAKCHFPQFSHYPVTSGKTRFFYECVLQDMLSCQFTHKYMGDSFGTKLKYPSDYETKISYSKMIISKIVSMEEYGHPCCFRQFINTKPPPGLFPSEYNYWDYVEAFDKVLLYNNPTSQHSWFIRCDLEKPCFIPMWFHQWLGKYGPEFEYLPRYYKGQFEKFHQIIHKSFRNPFYYFLLYFRIPWILSWNFCFHTFDDQGILISSLAYNINIRWWDKFTRSLVIPTKEILFPSKPVPPLIVSSPVLPPALSPNVYSWFLQLNEDNQGIPQDEAMKLAQLLHSYGAVPKVQREIAIEALDKNTVVIKDKAKAPIPDSQFAQSPWSPEDLMCTTCGKTGHVAIMCSLAPDPDFDFELGPRCYCCGQFGHTTIRCPAIGKSPSPNNTPTQVMQSQESSTGTVQRKKSPWSTAEPIVGPSTGQGPTKVEPTDPTGGSQG